jgi:hypothetical protein
MTLRRSAVVTLLALAINSPVAFARQPPTSCRGSEYRALDFWVGEWAVTNAKGQPAGTSMVETVSDGCAIVERFAGPGRKYVGTGLHYFDTASRTWLQYFADNRPVLTTMKGETIANGIRYTWDVVDSKGVRTPKRYDVTAEADGVRQHGERSNDGGKTWVTEFDLRYKRVRLQPDATSSAPS